MTTEQRDFSERLRQAIVNAGHEARPVVVENHFNRNWHGRPISTQTAWSWLNGKSIPTQDKLQVLATWLKVEPHALRFGVQVALAAQEYRQRWHNELTYQERETVDAYLQLPAPQRKVVREVILTFAKVHGGEGKEPDASTNEN